MKKSIIVIVMLALGIGFWSCNAHGDNPGRAYMPDMYYSRAYETYGYNDVHGEYDSLRRRGILYNGMPVGGSIARGDALPYHDLTPDSAGLKVAEALQDPLDTATALQTGMKEAERLYLVNCAICHGTALDGNGPLYNGGNGPYPAAPKNLMADDAKAWPDGHYYYVITFGKNTMGSYASQLRPEQRWWVTKYIRSKQGAGKGMAKASGSDSTTQLSPASKQPEGSMMKK